MRYELTDIRVFMAIADAKNLSIGAMNMHMTAPSASYRLKNLENALGVSLFDRTARGMVLTSAGESVYRYGEAMLSSADQLRTEMTRYNAGVTGHIKVFANSSTLSPLPVPLSRFLASHPTINIELEEHLSEESVRAVHDGLADIGLVASVVHLRGLEAIEYGHDELVFVTPRGHPLTTAERVTVDMALEHELVSVGKRSSNFLYLQQIANKLNKNMNVRVHLPDFDAALHCVQEGVGISLVPLSVARRSAKRRLVDIVHLSDHWAKRDQLIVMRSFSALPKYTQDFVQMLAAAESGRAG